MHLHLPSCKSKHQDNINAYDIDSNIASFPRYKRNSNSSRQDIKKQFFQPSHSMFINSITPSSSFDEEIHHETLVHPGMFTHDLPNKIAIIGNRKSGILREVLKHSTVEQVLMFNFDHELVKLSSKYRKLWNDCSDIINSTSSCINDPRVELMHENELGKFLNFNSNEFKLKFDVIVVDDQ